MKLISMAPDDMMRSYEAKRSVCDLISLNIIYCIITCNPEPQANSPEWYPVHKLIMILLNRFFLVN